MCVQQLREARTACFGARPREHVLLVQQAQERTTSLQTSNSSPPGAKILSRHRTEAGGHSADGSMPKTASCQHRTHHRTPTMARLRSYAPGGQGWKQSTPHNIRDGEERNERNRLRIGGPRGYAGGWGGDAPSLPRAPASGRRRTGGARLLSCKSGHRLQWRTWC